MRVGGQTLARVTTLINSHQLSSSFDWALSFFHLLVVQYPCCHWNNRFQYAMILGHEDSPVIIIFMFFRSDGNQANLRSAAYEAVMEMIKNSPKVSRLNNYRNSLEARASTREPQKFA